MSLHPDFEYRHLEQPSTIFFEDTTPLGSGLALPLAFAFAFCLLFFLRWLRCGWLSALPCWINAICLIKQLIEHDVHVAFTLIRLGGLLSANELCLRNLWNRRPSLQVGLRRRMPVGQLRHLTVVLRRQSFQACLRRRFTVG